MLLIELHPIDGEALRDDLVAVHDEQAPAMMCVVVAAPLARDPDAAAARAGPAPTASGAHRDATDQARELIDSSPGGGRAELTTRCSRTAGRSAFRCTGTSSQMTADPDGASRVVGGGATRRRVADRIHPRDQFRPGKREQYPVGLGIADIDSLDVDRERLASSAPAHTRCESAHRCPARRLGA